MANTYGLIQSTTLASDTSSITFSTIYPAYTDLVLRSSVRNATNGALFGSALITINGSTTNANYNTGRILLTGPSTVSASLDNGTTAGFSISPFGTGSTSLANTFGFCEIDIVGFNKTSFYLAASSFCLGGTGVVSPSITGGRWQGAAALTSITITANGGTFATGSSFSLYGISNT